MFKVLIFEMKNKIRKNLLRCVNCGAEVYSERTPAERCCYKCESPVKLIRNVLKAEPL
jgi:hypothetical protein